MLSGHEASRKQNRVDVRVDAETKRLLDELAALYRSNRSHVVRLAVAELARHHGVLSPPTFELQHADDQSFPAQGVKR